MEKQTSKQFMMTITIIHFALIMGPLLFCAFSIYLVSTNPIGESAKELHDSLSIIAPIILLILLIIGAILPKKRNDAIKAGMELKEKLGQYRVNSILKFAIMEGGAIFMVVCYFLTGDNLFIVLCGLTLFVLLINRPTKTKVVHDLNLNNEEQRVFNNPDSIVIE